LGAHWGVVEVRAVEQHKQFGVQISTNFWNH
jgi:hypothetical protein